MIELEISLDIKGEVKALLNRIRELAEINLMDGIQAAGDGARRIVAAATPDRTGLTQKAWSTTYTCSGMVARAVVFNPTQVAWWLEYGTPPHTIRPLHGKVLAIPVWTLHKPVYAGGPYDAKAGDGRYHKITGMDNWGFHYLEFDEGSRRVEGAEEYIFVTEVQHPGTPAYGMVRNHSNTIIRLLKEVGSGIMLSTMKSRPYYGSSYAAEVEGVVQTAVGAANKHA